MNIDPASFLHLSYLNIFSQWKTKKLFGLSACGEIAACNSLIPSCFLDKIQDTIQLRSGKDRRQEKTTAILTAGPYKPLAVMMNRSQKGNFPDETKGGDGLCVR